MRPAHCAREVLGGIVLIQAAGPASMRPAHCAREVNAAHLLGELAHHASMRPAHCAREVGEAGELDALSAFRFNEARALCAGSFPHKAGADAQGALLQ